MRLRCTPNGYVQFCIRIDGKYKYVYAHRMVYENFIGEIPVGMDINHIDGDKTNNDISNLEIVTRIENIRHSWEHGLAYKHNPHIGGHTQKRLEGSISLETVKTICEYLENPMNTYSDIAKMCDVNPSIVNKIARGIICKKISKDYDISNRDKKRRKLFKLRDKKIIELKSLGLSTKDIANKLDSTYDAIARRLYLLRKKGYNI